MSASSKADRATEAPTSAHRRRRHQRNTRWIRSDHGLCADGWEYLPRCTCGWHGTWKHSTAAADQAIERHIAAHLAIPIHLSHPSGGIDA